MKRIAALIISAVLLCSMLCVGSFAAGSKEILSRESDWEYLEFEEIGTEAPEGWATGEDDSQDWFNGTAPLGNSTNGNVVTPMSWNNFSCYMRTTFTLDDLKNLETFGMNIIYDEDPVVYINGTEVWSASGYKDRDYNFVSLADYTDCLKTGENYIAVYFQNALGGAILDLDLVLKSTINDDGTFLAKKAESFDGEGNPKSNPWGAIGDVSNMFDLNSTTIWGFPYVENMNVVVEYFDTFKLESITLGCKDEGPIPLDETHGTYKIEALVDDEWVVVAEEIQVYAYDAYMDESTVNPETEIVTNTIKITITSWHEDLIETYWGGIAELEVRGEAINTEPAPEPTPTPTPDVTPDVTPDTTPVVTPDATPDETPEDTKAPATTTPADTTPSGNTDDGSSNAGLIIAIVVVAVIVVAGVVFFVLKKKK